MDYVRRPADRLNPQVPTIIVDSPDKHIAYIDEVNSPLGSENGEPSKEPSKEEKEDKEDKDGKDGKDEPEVTERRQSLRRNSVSLPNLDELELQVLRDAHERRIRENNQNDDNIIEEMSEDELLSTTGLENIHIVPARNARRKSVTSPKMLKPPPDDEEAGNGSNGNSVTSVNSLASLLKEKIQMLPSTIKKKKPSNYKSKIFTLCMFITIAFLIGSGWHWHHKNVSHKAYFNHIKFSKAKRAMKIFNSDNVEIISGRLGTTLGSSKVHPCLPADDRNDGSLCLEWMNSARLYMDYYELNGDVKCYNMLWMSLSRDIQPTDCIDVSPSSGYWYGGGQTASAAWSLERSDQKLAPFITGRIEKHQWGNVLKRYFINSKGAALIVDEKIPLYISINQTDGREMCLKAKHDDFAYVNHLTEYPHLNYSICTTPHMNITKTHSLLTEKTLWDGLTQNDISIINSLLTEPLWEITAASKSELTEGTISNYTNNVIGLGFLRQGHVLINEFWQKHIGDFTVDNERFAGLEDTINIMHRRGFRIVFTIQPFISTESENFAETAKEHLLISERSSDRWIPALTRYKSVSSAGVLDITNNRTVPWLMDKLQDVRYKYEIDAFYLDLGVAYSMPHYYQCEKRLINPDQYKTIFLNSLQGSIPLFSIDSAIDTPKPPVFVSLPQFESSWDGLRRVIPTVLTYGLIGYPFLIPGAVGGDYDESGNSSSAANEEEILLPDKELYIRWLQLATFLPVIRFKHLPSTYGDDKVLEMAKILTNLRQNMVSPLLKKFSSEALDSGLPMIRPLWMLESNDPACHMVHDEFSIGEDLIVAPVLYSGVRQREIYLPAGVWKDGIDGSLRKGSRWIHDYKVDSDQVAYFKKMPLNTRL